MPHRLLLVLLLTAAPSLAGELSAKERKQLERQLQTSSDPVVRVAVIARLATDDSSRSVEVLLSVGVASTSVAVDEAIRSGLAGARSAEGLAALLAPLETRRDLRACLLVLDVLGRRTDAATGEALGRALADGRPELLRVALAAIERRKPVEAIPGLFDLVERVTGRAETPALIERTARAVLSELTGRHYEVVADWRTYWQIRRESAGGAAPPAGRAAPPAERTTERKGPTFFGSEVRSDRVVFVLDVSHSMEGRRIERAREELIGAIEGLAESARFTVVAFAKGSRAWRPELTPATAANKADARAWIEAVQLARGTETLSALEAAYRVEGADAIVLLTDGRPTDKGPDGERLEADAFLDAAVALGRWPRWRVDVFGLLGGRKRDGEDPDEAPEALLRGLAEANGGTFAKVRPGKATPDE